MQAKRAECGALGLLAAGVFGAGQGGEGLAFAPFAR